MKQNSTSQSGLFHSRVLLAFKRMMKSRSLLAAFVLGTTALFGASARGQQYQVLHQFHANVAWPNGLIQGSDGNFYGTAQFGGAIGAGAVFKMDASGAVTTLHSFTGSDGVHPHAALIQGSDGSFYGTTSEGGASGYGTVFKITPSGTFTSLHSFAGTDGASPHFGRWIQASDGNFYGTTSQGGGHNLGTVFKITPSGTLTTLHSFAGSDGSQPYAGLIRGSDGNFYGTAGSGGVSGVGTVFKMDASGAVTTLHSFAGSDGAYPSAELIEGSDGSFYGTTEEGGGPNNRLNRGTVFKITPSGAFTSLHSFALIDGVQPLAGLIKGSDGNFYGTTNQGGTNGANGGTGGTVFKMDSAGTVTSLYSFAGNDGANPSAGLIQASDGNFYGTTSQGGAENDGTVFRMNTSGTVTTVTTLYSFTGGDGFPPYGGLIQGSDGDFYGTTQDGGASGANGTVFKMDSAGTLTTLHSFTGSDGLHPTFCRLIEGSDGNFYGTTANGGLGGSGGYGTVFKITPAGVLTTLHSFANIDGSYPSVGLTKGSDGNFYGLTTFGGTSSGGYGTVFKITPAGTLTSLHSFAGSDGQFPFSTVIQGSDGNLYGTTEGGGASGAGTVFKMDASGALTTLHSFTGSDGFQPHGGLIQGSDGNFYGMTPFGGTSNKGTVFMITSSGALTTLHFFAGSDGSLPYGELTHGSDGNFYGTTAGGGLGGSGTVFKITSSGALTTLYSFAGSDGSSPYGGPIQASDGSFYGTTSQGGLSYGGVAYRIATVQLVSAVSRKSHGIAGTFDIDLPQTGPPGIECRSGGANGDYQMVVTFALPVTFTSATVSSGTGGVTTALSSGNQVFVNLTGVANAQRITLTLFGVNDGTSRADFPVSMGVLLGDVNATGLVDGNDVSAVQGQARQTANSTNFRLDVNATGLIDGNDVSLVQSKTRTSLP